MDRVKAHRIDIVIEQFGGALVKDAHLRTERVVGLIILFVLPVHFLADHRAGFAAVLEVLGLDGLFVELLQVMVQDEILMLVQARLDRRRWRCS